VDKSTITKEALRRFPKARKLAVTNFVGTLIGTNRTDEELNLIMDAKLYNWNLDTIEAIAFGIDTYYNILN
jgi:hypothetical protein